MCRRSWTYLGFTAADESKGSVNEEVQRVNILAQFGGKRISSQIPTAIGPYPIFSAGPSLAAPIFDLTLWRRYQNARETVSASKANSLSTREQVILLVVSQYIGTLRAVADVEASQSRVDLAQALYDQAADLQKEGVGTGIDTLRAGVRRPTTLPTPSTIGCARPVYTTDRFDMPYVRVAPGTGSGCIGWALIKSTTSFAVAHSPMKPSYGGCARFACAATTSTIDGG